MLRLFSTIQKELLILLRDRGGLAVMFLMPLAMVIIMALIQDAPFKDYMELKIPLLFVNNDKGNLGASIEKGLQESKIFEITNEQNEDEKVKQRVKAGDFEIGIIIPANATEQLNNKVNTFVSEKLSAAGLGDSTKTTATAKEDVNLQILFAPDTKKSFKVSIVSLLQKSISKMETQTLLHSFGKELNKEGEEIKEEKPMEDFISLTEVNTVETPKEALLLNSVQHNVPAWTIFGIFFIVISLSGSIIKERTDGSYTRILTMPGSYITVLSGKIAAYLLICLIQCILMLMVGYYLLPHLGLPQLIIGNSFLSIAIVALCSGLAATGYGVLVGTLFSTHQQASTFGAVSIIILAALGGIWVPVYVMPDSLRILSNFSPLYWGLTAFQKIFLNQGGIETIIPYCLKLLAFFAGMLGISFFYNKWEKV